jgi:sugar lactone lactonase YvrE
LRVQLAVTSLVLSVLTALSVLAMVALAVVWTIFPTHGRVVAAEQVILTPWLRPAYLGDGKPAAELLLCYPMGLAINRAGELLISDRGRERRGRVVWRIDSHGIAHIVAGTGRRGDATARRALELDLERPEGLAVAADGSVLLSDGFNHSVYRIDPDGRVERVAGSGSPGFSGDGGIASQARLFRPADIRLDRRGNLFIADVRNHRVRKVDPSGRISTVAGTGEPGFSPDGTPAVRAQLDTPWGLGLDLQDRLLIADGANHRVRRVEDDGRLVTLAGNGRQGFDGDGGLATEASLNFPEGLFVDPSGRLFVGDEWNSAVRVVDTDGIISTVIGTGFPGRALVGGVAGRSPLDDPESVLATPDGLIISDGNNGRVLRIANDGIIHLVAGRGEIGPCASRW